MNTIGPITLVMIKHHVKINKILIDFEKISNREISEFKRVFEKFRKKIEKHFFIEERNVFPVSDKNNAREVLQLENLLKDHRDLKEIIREMENDIINEKKPKTNILRELLFAHEQREVESFYPLLDNRLLEQNKKKIVDSINEERF